MTQSQQVYLFSAHKSNFPSAVFTSYAQASTWIESNHLSGILMEYPQDQSCYDWAMAQGHFKDKSAIFIILSATSHIAFAFLYS